MMRLVAIIHTIQCNTAGDEDDCGYYPSNTAYHVMKIIMAIIHTIQHSRWWRWWWLLSIQYSTASDEGRSAEIRLSTDRWCNEQVVHLNAEPLVPKGAVPWPCFRSPYSDTAGLRRTILLIQQISRYGQMFGQLAASGVHPFVKGNPALVSALSFSKTSQIWAVLQPGAGQTGNANERASDTELMVTKEALTSVRVWHSGTMISSMLSQKRVVKHALSRFT